MIVPLNGPDECMCTIRGKMFMFISRSMKNYRLFQIVEKSVGEGSRYVKIANYPEVPKAT